MHDPTNGTYYAMRAHQAAEERLEAAFLVLAAEEDDEPIEPAVVEAAAGQLSAPFCGCTTCLIREVLDAAYPHIARLVTAAVSMN